MAMTPKPGRKPKTRKISLKSLVHTTSGLEQPYPVYRYSGRNFVERPKHNPFKQAAQQGFDGDAFDSDAFSTSAFDTTAFEFSS